MYAAVSSALNQPCAEVQPLRDSYALKPYLPPSSPCQWHAAEHMAKQEHTRDLLARRDHMASIAANVETLPACCAVATMYILCPRSRAVD